MAFSRLIPLSVLVGVEDGDPPWQMPRWRPLGVSLEGPWTDHWRPVGANGRRDAKYSLFQSGRTQLVLKAEETAGYEINLAGEEPVVYIVSREVAAPVYGSPVRIEQISATPFAMPGSAPPQVALDRVPMPVPLIGIVRGFIQATLATASSGSTGATMPVLGPRSA